MMKAAGEDNIALINAHLITTHPDILIPKEPSSLKNNCINYDYNCFGEDNTQRLLFINLWNLKFLNGMMN